MTRHTQATDQQVIDSACDQIANKLGCARDQNAYTAKGEFKAVLARYVRTTLADGKRIIDIGQSVEGNTILNDSLIAGRQVASSLRCDEKGTYRLNFDDKTITHIDEKGRETLVYGKKKPGDSFAADIAGTRTGNKRR